MQEVERELFVTFPSLLTELCANGHHAQCHWFYWSPTVQSEERFCESIYE